MKNANITIAASVATAYTEAAHDIVSKRRATLNYVQRSIYCRQLYEVVN